MAINKDQKKELVAKLESVLKGSKGAVFVGFKGLKVNDATKMRKGFRANGVDYAVVKKTLLNRAFDSVQIEGDRPSFDGEVAVAYSADNLSPSREVGAFLKQNKGALQILGGVFDGKFITREDVVAYSSIPDKKTLYAQVVNLFNSPIQGLVIALSEIAGKKGTAPAPTA